MNHFFCESGKSTQSSSAVGDGETGRSVTAARGKLYGLFRLFRKQRRGAAVVEFAVVAPMFFLLVLGMIEYGRMIMVQQVITNASREGARRAVLDGSTTQDVENVIDTYLTSGSVDGATVTVEPDPPGSVAFGEPVSVTVSVGFDQVSWLPSPMFLGGRTLSAATTMRRESVQ